MTFTYLGTLATDLDKIRFKIGDTVSGSGVKPTGTNFTDEEISGLLAIEGTVERTIAALYETLGATYARFIDTKIGPRDEKLSQIRDSYFQLAKTQRDLYGTGVSTIRFGFVTRVDGYSDDIDSGET